MFPTFGKMFTVMTIQLRLKPMEGKSAQLVSAASASTPKRFQTPVGSSD